MELVLKPFILLPVLCTQFEIHRVFKSNIVKRLVSVADAAIQVNGKLEFEDGLMPEAMGRPFVTHSSLTSFWVSGLPGLLASGNFFFK